MLISNSHWVLTASIRNHKHTSWSTISYRLIPGIFSADHGWHSSRCWACCSHSRWHSDHEQGWWWTAYPESEHCSQLLRQLRFATPAQQVQVHAAFTNLHRLRHLCWRNFPNGGKGWSHQESTTPSKCTQLGVFLGMTNYQGKFISNMITIPQPLNQLLQKDQEFLWSPHREEAFNKAKESLSS